MTDRNRRLEELGWSTSLLAQKTALVAGAGALGNEVIKNGSLVGIGRMIVADVDRIEEHNLTRSVLFRERDVGAFKVDVACRRAMALNPAIHAIPLRGLVQSRLGLGAFRRFDVVFGCLDNIQTRLHLNRACMATGTPYIDGGLNQLDGEVRCFAPPFDVCFDCGLSEEMRERASERYSCLKLFSEFGGESRATAPTSASLVGGLMVHFAVKHFHGMAIPTGEAIGYLGAIDDPYRTSWRRNPGCPSHSDVRRVEAGGLLELDRTSDELPLRELVEIVRSELGRKAVLRTSFELVETLSCKRCQSRQEVLERKELLTFDKVVCRSCEMETTDSLTDLLRVPEERFEFSGSEPYAGKPLAEIGFAPLDIYSGALDGEEVLVEVSGDERILFARQQLETAGEKAHLRADQSARPQTT